MLLLKFDIMIKVMLFELYAMWILMAILQIEMLRSDVMHLTKRLQAMETVSKV